MIIPFGIILYSNVKKENIKNYTVMEFSQQELDVIYFFLRLEIPVLLLAKGDPSCRNNIKVLYNTVKYTNLEAVIG